MRFQTKIIAGYAIFVFALALIIGFAYHSYTFEQYRKTEENNLRVAADQLCSQMEERISRMELATEYILSDPNILESLQILGKVGDGNISEQYIEHAKSEIQSGISTYYITNNFYRAVVFNQNKDIFSTYNSLARRVKTEVDFGEMEYIEEADLNKGKPIIISAHDDPWGLQESCQVFSLLKAIQGKNMGYIEIQYQVESLSQLQLPKKELSYIIMINEDELLYSSNDETVLSEYKKLLKLNDEFVKTIEKKEGDEVLAAKSVSGQYPITILVLEDTKEVSKMSSYNTPMTFAIALAFFSVSMIFVILLSRILTKPIRQLRLVMENTRLENLGENVSVDAPNDEIKALSISYKDVMERLQESMVKEQRLSMLQLQAQFDSLQAQVNPHFMYNVLNIISARGMIVEDEKICEMCGSLAAMLRYSTNNKDRYATVREELKYLEQYFYLLKARYEHKIEFMVEVDKSIMEELIPKVALQQVVENCINHGFENSVDQMEVVISGWQDRRCWYIKVHDNGQGFKESVLKELGVKIETTRRRILKERNNMELEIGGMGLINTYARCLLLYHDKLIFKMGNGIDGADVVMGAELNTKE